jgi:hypothetical protein
VSYPNFGPKNTCSKCFSIFNMCLLLLKDCQFAIILHWYFTLLYLPIFAPKIFSNCEFVYVFLHLKPSKCFSCISSHVEVVSDQLHVSLHFISILFAKFITKGYFSHFMCPTSFLISEIASESFQVVCIGPWSNSCQNPF